MKGSEKKSHVTKQSEATENNWVERNQSSSVSGPCSAAKCSSSEDRGTSTYNMLVNQHTRTSLIVLRSLTIKHQPSDALLLFSISILVRSDIFCLNVASFYWSYVLQHRYICCYVKCINREKVQSRYHCYQMSSYLLQNDNISGPIEPWLQKEMDSCISNIFVDGDQDTFIQLFNLIFSENVNGTNIRAISRTDIRIN